MSVNLTVDTNRAYCPHPRTYNKLNYSTTIHINDFTSYRHAITWRFWQSSGGSPWNFAQQRLHCAPMTIFCLPAIDSGKCQNAFLKIKLLLWQFEFFFVPREETLLEKTYFIVKSNSTELVCNESRRFHGKIHMDMVIFPDLRSKNTASKTKNIGTCKLFTLQLQRRCISSDDILDIYYYTMWHEVEDLSHTKFCYCKATGLFGNF